MECVPGSSNEIDAEVKGSGLAGESTPQPAQKKVILSTPPKELTSRLLSKVSFAERLLAQRFFQMSGALKVDIYSLEEAICFLEKCNNRYSSDEFLVTGSKASVSYIDLNSLRNWVGETLGDKELAEAIRTELGEGLKSKDIAEMGKYFRMHVGPVRDLLEQRLRQCKEIVGEGTES